MNSEMELDSAPKLNHHIKCPGNEATRNKKYVWLIMCEATLLDPYTIHMWVWASKSTHPEVIVQKGVFTSVSYLQLFPEMENQSWNTSRGKRIETINVGYNDLSIIVHTRPRNRIGDGTINTWYSIIFDKILFKIIYVVK